MKRHLDGRAPLLEFTSYIFCHGIERGTFALEHVERETFSRLGGGSSMRIF